jgi:hypothetical protein
MDLINDLGTDLALAFLVDQRYRQKVDPARARAIIDQVTRLLESSPTELVPRDDIDPDRPIRFHLTNRCIV